MNKILLKRIETLFYEKLQAKTGWGRNEVKKKYSEAVNEALMEALEDFGTLDASEGKTPFNDTK